MNKAYATIDSRENGRQVVLGIELSRKAVRLVELRGTRITAWARVVYPTELTTTSPDFPAFLAHALEPFEPHRRHARLWLLGSFPSLQVRFLTVPRTTARHMSNVVYWTFRKELPFDPALSLFDYDTEGTHQSGKNRQVDVTAYSVLQAEVNEMATLFDQAGHSLSGIVIPHFAMRNLFRAGWLESDHACVGLHVGEEASTVQIYCAGKLVLSRVFMTGMRALLDAVREEHPDWSNDNILRRLQKEAPQGATEVSPLFGLALGRLMHQLERTMSAYLVNEPSADIRHIYIIGPLAAFPQLTGYMGGHLGIDAQAVQVVSPPHLAADVSPPDATGESSALSMAAAAALSPTTHAPNVLQTHVVRDRIQHIKHRRAQAAALVAGALVLLGAGYVGARQYQQTQQQTLSSLKQQEAQYPADLSRERIIQLVAQERERNSRLKALARDCRPIAIISDIAGTTPADIRLTLLRLEQGNAQNRVVMEGVVRGTPATQESRLASYIIQLEDHALFQTATVHRAIPGREGQDNTVLMFDLELKLESVAPPPNVVAVAKETP